MKKLLILLFIILLSACATLLSLKERIAKDEQSLASLSSARVPDCPDGDKSLAMAEANLAYAKHEIEEFWHRKKGETSLSSVESDLSEAEKVYEECRKAIVKPNLAPIVSFEGPAKAKVGEEVSFDGRASKDPEEKPLNFAWDFGDGSKSEGTASTSHIYNKTGPYTVSLEAADPAGATASISKPIEIEEKVIQVYILETTHFEFNKYTLTKKGKKILDEAAKKLMEEKEASVKIEGHTCNIGTEKYNLRLSEKRANAVYSYLKKKGVTDGRIEVKGYGESKPAFSNTTKEGREKNRRVEISIIRK
jgi:outer membrane protein OmpA-like peptidoglycan-associated protein